MSGPQNVTDEPLFLPSQDRYQQGNDRFPTSTDVIVVGGGLVGLSTAVELADRGRKVSVVCESLQTNQTTTGLGMLLSYLPATPSELEQAHGADSASVVQSSVDAYSWTLEKLGTIDRRFPCRIAGHLICGHDSDDAVDMRRLVEFERQRKNNSAFLSKQEMTQEIGSARFNGALSLPDAAVVDPGQVHLGFHHMARQLGIPIFDRTRVVRIDRLARHGFELRTSHGRIRAHDVVVCTGHRLGELLPALRTKVGEHRTINVVLPPLDLDINQQLAPTNRVMSDNAPQRNFWYFDPSRGQLIYSMPAAGADLELERERATASLLSVYPELRHLRAEQAWFSSAPISLDRVPRVGVSDGVTFAVKGHAHQLAYSSWLGHQASELIMDGNAHRGSTRPWSKVALPGGEGRGGLLGHLVGKASALLSGTGGS